MEMNLARYLAGSAFHARTLYVGGGRRVQVFDRTKRWRQSARSMRAGGRTDHQIAHALGITRELLDRALAFGWRF